MEVMRALWTNQTVAIEGEFHTIVGAGLVPNAVQRPIPLWLGGWSDRVLERIGRLADGWYYGREVPDDIAERQGIVTSSAECAGRDPGEIGLEGAVEMRFGLDGIDQRAAGWEKAGATHLVVDTQLGGCAGAEHIALLDRIAERLPTTL
jgi:alkanesulfonate monooxygenase SsuD/methylene tetrahydromethanopterin reductase-like flavin-dependent oxidoreductase (luciferase family)